MPFSRGVATPEELAILKDALDHHCKARNISDPIERENIAHVVMSLFNRGAASVEGLKETLDEIANRIGR